MNVLQEKYDTNDWEKVFDRLRELQSQNLPNLRLVLSTHTYTSGYWIEQSVTLVNEDFDKAYTIEEAFALENRIKAEIEAAKKEERPCQFIV